MTMKGDRLKGRHLALLVRWKLESRLGNGVLRKMTASVLWIVPFPSHYIYMDTQRLG